MAKQVIAIAIGIASKFVSSVAQCSNGYGTYYFNGEKVIFGECYAKEFSTGQRFEKIVCEQNLAGTIKTTRHIYEDGDCTIPKTGNNEFNMTPYFTDVQQGLSPKCSAETNECRYVHLRRFKCDQDEQSRKYHSYLLTDIDFECNNKVLRDLFKTEDHEITSQGSMKWQVNQLSCDPCLGIERDGSIAWGQLYAQKNCTGDVVETQNLYTNDENNDNKCYQRVDCPQKSNVETCNNRRNIRNAPTQPLKNAVNAILDILPDGHLKNFVQEAVNLIENARRNAIGKFNMAVGYLREAGYRLPWIYE